MKFKAPNINQLEEVCCIQKLDKLKNKNTHFPHPIGIVVHPGAIIGRNCTIYQNVTIGQGKYQKETNSTVPRIGDNVIIYPNSVIIGGVKIGNNSIIGAGSIVISNIPQNSIAAGNPAKVIKQHK